MYELCYEKIVFGCSDQVLGVLTRSESYYTTTENSSRFGKFGLTNVIGIEQLCKNPVFQMTQVSQYQGSSHSHIHVHVLSGPLI